MDIAEERGLEVDESGFHQAMEQHREISGGGRAMGDLGGKEVELYHQLLTRLQKAGDLDSSGVRYQPYDELILSGEILALVQDGEAVGTAEPGDRVKVIVPRTPFYLEAGGQMADTGMIRGNDWEISISDVYQPAAGMIVHTGEVKSGQPQVGDQAETAVDIQRRRDIMRNHTGTHLLHARFGQGAGRTRPARPVPWSLPIGCVLTSLTIRL